MKIRFVRKFKPAGNAPDIPTYGAGEVYEFVGPVSEGYANKYIARGLAVEHKDEPAPVVEAAVEASVPDVVEAVVEEPKVEVPVVQPRQQINFRNNRRHGR